MCDEQPRLHGNRAQRGRVCVYQSQVPATRLLFALNAADFPQKFIVESSSVVVLVVTGGGLILLLSPETQADRNKERQTNSQSSSKQKAVMCPVVVMRLYSHSLRRATSSSV